MKKFTLLLSVVIVSGMTVRLEAAKKSAANMGEGQPKSNQFWWPDQLDLSPLRIPNPKSNPYGASFHYAEAFKKLDLNAVKKDIDSLLTSSQAWWPADYGNYGPLFIRMAWHSAGTYRTIDGRGGAGGGQQRFDPLNSWPDNANLDKARRLLWPVKQKYGNSISWADLMVLAGNVAMENMGFKTLGFAGGREDDWEAELVDWGPESNWLEGKRRDPKGKLKGPLAAVQMGLIYVNPEGPNSNHDPKSAAKDIRESFGRMAMDDEEIVALIAGGHTFGKVHGAHKPGDCVEAEPGAAPIEQQGLGWKNNCGQGNAQDTVTSGLEGAWTSEPAKFTHQFLSNLLKFEWKQVKSPAGATQWIPTDASTLKMVPDAHIKGKFHAPIMLTTDLALKEDPGFRKISERFRDNPKQFEEAFARAWFKLTHRDMGPRARYIGPEVPAMELLWQDPIPKGDPKAVGASEIKQLKAKILASGLSVPELIRTAWAAASTYRASDMRGGANGARVRLEPQKNWSVNNPAELSKVISRLEDIRKGSKISMADLIVLGGVAAVEKAAKDAGLSIDVPFRAGRGDAQQAQTDVSSFAVLEPKADGFRNYYHASAYRSPTEMLIDKASLLNLSVPEMTVLIGGLRVLDANTGGSRHGVFTSRPGVLTNDFFINVLDSSTAWKKSSSVAGVYEGADRKSGQPKWTATSVDLMFGSNSELRAVAEVYAYNNAQEKFVRDFVAAWDKVMNLDWFDSTK